MPDTLVVHVNRERPQTIEVEAESFETTGSFALALRNHGQPIHVHVHLDDALSPVASLEAVNHYVDADSTTRVPVTVEGSRRPVTGKVKLVTGYGAQTEYVDVELVEPGANEEHVEVDETLSRPRVRSTEPADRRPVGDSSIVRNGPIAALGGVAILLAAGVASMIGGPTAMVGAFVVIVGVVVAAYLLLAS